MRNIFLMLLFCALGFGAQAQLRAQVGLEAGIGSGDGSFDSPTGLGVTALGEFVFKERIGINFQTGYTIFRSGKGEGNIRSMTPFLGGLRYYFSAKKSEGVYVHGKFGVESYKILKQGLIPSAMLTTAGAGIGWIKLKDISVEISYVAFITDADPKSFISVKAMYNF